MVVVIQNFIVCEKPHLISKTAKLLCNLFFFQPVLYQKKVKLGQKLIKISYKKGGPMTPLHASDISILWDRNVSQQDQRRVRIKI